ncbi:hypothetical protein LPBF_02650 [Flavobacterium crassostreae]|uniref:Uncharacterized protein n=1 Tax=Flavobacterium crassostreae TaxID=1763534 RepID=A0A1B9E7J4_9FLAO|nr:hypothetical protein LPBF_02650 [Flavobacterium crassostreae]
MFYFKSRPHWVILYSFNNKTQTKSLETFSYKTANLLAILVLESTLNFYKSKIIETKGSIFTFVWFIKIYKT